MEARLAGQLGMERGGDDVALPDGDDASVVQPREHVDAGPDALDDRCADEDAVDRRVAEDRHRQVRLEGVQLAPEGVALDRDVEQRQDRLVAVGDLAREQDHAGAGAEDRRARRRQVEDRLAQAPAVDELAHRRALAAGQDEAGEAVEVGRQAHLDALDADLAQHGEVLGERTLDGEDADHGASHGRAPGGASLGRSSSRPARPARLPAADRQPLALRDGAELEAAHRGSEALRDLGDDLGVVEVGRGLDDGVGRASRVLAT